MSIYRRTKAATDNDVTAPVAPDALGARLPPKIMGGLQGFVHLRKSDPVNVVLPASRRWLESLPEDVQPRRLAAAYPRIINLIALEWSAEAAISRLFADLLVDRRGGREGFPPEIMQELRALRDHRYTGRAV